MKKLRMLTVMALVGGLVLPALAACPDSGYFRTQNGTLLPGRVSEAWCGAAEPGQPGNTENAQSWDGTMLGGQWKVWGQAIDALGAVEGVNTVNSQGDGYIDYQTNYTGGQIWLSGAHAWSVDGQDLTGSVTYFNVGSRVQYSNFEIVAVNANLYMSAAIDGCDRCEVAYTIANAELVWQSGFGEPMPTDYPEFMCSASLGELFDSCCIVCAITCDGVQTETQSWGGVKSLYR